jgi:hypothetical protein
MKQTSKRRKPRKTNWPPFHVDVEDANPRFAEEVLIAIEAFRFEELPNWQQKAYQDLRLYGGDDVLRHISAAMKMVQEEDPTNLSGTCVELAWVCTLGQLIFNKIPDATLTQFLPFNDVRFHLNTPFKGILVEVRSLVEVDTGKETLWHSRLKPTVEVGGRKYTVAFTKHAIDAVKKRINPRWKFYTALGDMFAFFDQCTYFEQVRLRNTTKSGERQLGLTFYDMCGNKPFWRWRYVEEVLGVENLKAGAGSPYYRVGYCPAFLDDESGCIKLGTLLFPGFKQTPEYQALLASSLPQEERERMEHLASNQNAEVLLDTGDLSVIKWFHDNGVPQVIQRQEPIYQTFPKREFCIRHVIWK